MTPSLAIIRFHNMKKIYSRCEITADCMAGIALITTLSIPAIYSLTFWYLILVAPIGAWIATWILIYIFVFSMSFLCSKKKEYGKPSKFYYSLFNLGYDALIGSARVTIHVDGLDKVPDDSCFLLASNHLSRFDNMIQSYVLRNHIISYISKPSNFKIPFGNRYMNRSLYLSIDRDSPIKALRTINKATDLLTNDITSIGVFPEGTRSKDYELHEFKPGCMRIAVRSKKPVLVICMDNTQYIHKNYPWKRTHVYMRIIDCLDMSKEETNTIDLANRLEEMIKQDLATERTTRN